MKEKNFKMLRETKEYGCYLFHITSSIQLAVMSEQALTNIFFPSSGYHLTPTNARLTYFMAIVRRIYTREEINSHYLSEINTIFK